MNTPTQFKTLIQKVEHVLEEFPETRNSDVALTIQIRKVFFESDLKYNVFKDTHYVDVKKLFKLPREDNVKRIRARIQNKQHRFLPTKLSVVKKRKINEELWRQMMRE